MPRQVIAGDQILDSILRYACSVCPGTVGRFFWADHLQRVADVYGMPHDGNLSEVYWTVSENDPLRIEKLGAQNSTIAVLNDQSPLTAGESAYKEILRSYKIENELDMVFWRDDLMLGGLALFARCEKVSLNLRSYDWSSLRLLLEVMLCGHTRTKLAVAHDRLTRQFGLTAREQEVLSHLAMGMTNQDIADALQVGISTTKTHIVRIMDKLGVETRTAATAKYLQFL